MDYKTYKISDSVILSHIKTERFKKARLTAVLRTAITQDLSPMTSLIMPVAFLGTEKYPSFRSICCRAEELYAADLSDINMKLGNYQLTGLAASMLNENYISEHDREQGFSILSGVMEMFSELLFKALFRPENVETEKVNQINRINSRKNDAFGYAKYRFTKEMFKGEPCGHSLSGEVEQVTAITAQQLREHCQGIVKTAPMEFFYCGNAEAQAVIELIKKYFPNRTEGADVNVPSTVTAASETPKYIEENGLYRQGNLLLGFRTGNALSDREFYAVELMNQIFGDGSTSKLFMNVREKKSLCYFCASSYDEIRGAVLVGCGINNADYSDALNEILFQLEEIRKGNISDAELENAVRAIENDCRAAEDNPADYEDFGRTERLFGGPHTIDEYLRGALSVTKEEIAEAAQRMKLDTVYFLRGVLEGSEDDE